MEQHELKVGEVALTLKIGEVTLSLDEAEETLRAIRSGQIDAVVVESPEGEEVFTFRDPSHPYRLLVESMNEGAALLTLDGVICFHNRHFADLTREPKDSLMGRQLSELVSGEEEPALEELLRLGRTGPARQTVTFVGAGGRDGVPVQLSISLGLLADVPVFCVVATDLSEHNRHQEEYRAARLEIEARDRLFSVAAHELRGPLSVIEMETALLADALRDTEGSGSPKEQKRIGSVARLQRQGRQLASLVGALLDIGSIGAGRLRLKREQTDLAEVVTAAVEKSATQLDRSGSEVELDTQSVTGRWDPVRLEQVATNLITNAAKFGQGRPIRISVCEAGMFARLVVEDHGGGIPPQDRERLFKPYERMPMATKISGLGLGLYIAAEIVAAHGGTITIDDSPGGGARFVVELPIAAAAQS